MSYGSRRLVSLYVVVKHLFEGAAIENLKNDHFGDVEAATPESTSFSLSAQITLLYPHST